MTISVAERAGRSAVQGCCPGRRRTASTRPYGETGRAKFITAWWTAYGGVGLGAPEVERSPGIRAALLDTPFLARRGADRRAHHGGRRQRDHRRLLPGWPTVRPSAPSRWRRQHLVPGGQSAPATTRCAAPPTTCCAGRSPTCCWAAATGGPRDRHLRSGAGRPRTATDGRDGVRPLGPLSATFTFDGDARPPDRHRGEAGRGAARLDLAVIALAR